MAYELIQSEYRHLEKEIKILQSKIDRLPKGKLIYTRNGKYSKWYYNDGQETRHLSKKKREFAQQLSYKKLLLLQLDKLRREKKALDFYLRHHNQDAENAEQNFYNSSEFQELLSEKFKPLITELDEWSKVMHESNDLYEEKKVYATLSGHMVRSKSEVLIATILYQNNIPFRYECPWEIDGKRFYPDFLVRHPRTGQWFLWEHFGMMDDPQYAARVFSKLRVYAENGIIPGVNLITTYETSEHPLSVKMIENMIQLFFM